MKLELAKDTKKTASSEIWVLEEREWEIKKTGSESGPFPKGFAVVRRPHLFAYQLDKFDIRLRDSRVYDHAFPTKKAAVEALTSAIQKAEAKRD